MPLLILKQCSKFTKNCFLVQNAPPIEQEPGRLRRNDMWQPHAAGGARHGIGDGDGDGDGDVCAVLDAEHNHDVAGDQGVNTVCASLGTS